MNKTPLRFLLPAALAVALLTAPIMPAHADWYGTTWNMSVEEADKSLLLPHQVPAPSITQNPGAKKISTTYTFNGMELIWSILEFNAKGDRLSDVSLNLKNPEECDRAMETMNTAYGKPVREETHSGYMNPVNRRMTWDDPKNHNEITVHYISWRSLSPDCFIEYTPFPAPPPGPKFELQSVSLPKESPDLVLRCKWFVNLLGEPPTYTFRIWNSGVANYNDETYPATVDPSEIVFSQSKEEDLDNNVTVEGAGVIDRASGLLRFVTRHLNKEGKVVPSPHPETFPPLPPAAQCELAQIKF